MTNLETILSYARRGWPVFPVYGISSDGMCSCGDNACKNPGKHPRTKHGLQDATIDENLITSWYSQAPDANWAVVTGQVSGLVVLDVDTPKGGDISLEDLQEVHSWVYETPVAKTGGGGLHVYLKHPRDRLLRNSAGKIGPGLDVRGDGGYVLVPPSKTVGPYEWDMDPEDCELETIPDWLLSMMEANNGQDQPLSSNGTVTEGARNTWLTSLAGSLRKRGLSDTAILQALTAANLDQCDPPLADDEVRRIAQSSSQWIPGELPQESPQWEIKPVITVGDAATDLIARLEKGDSDVIPIGFTALDRKGAARRAELLVLAGRPSMGKTQLGLQAAYNVVRSGGVVLVASLEMANHQVAGRIASALRQVSFRDPNPERRNLVIETLRELMDLRGLVIVDWPITTQELYFHAQVVKQDYGKLDLIVTDHLRLFKDEHTDKRETKRLGMITNNQRTIAKDMDCAVIACAQLNRGPEGREDRRPGLGDLRDSGEIEEDADVVAFIYREQYYKSRKDPTVASQSGPAEIYTAKNRNGELWAVRLYFDAEHGARFTDISYTPGDIPF